MVILPFGERALLAEVASLADVIALHARLAASRPDGVVDLVPAARTVLVRVDPARLPLAAARRWLTDAAASAGGPAREAGEEDAPRDADTAEVTVPIVYDGADLAETASVLGIDVDTLVARHRDAVWTVAFTGFAPGFGYLVSDDWPFDVPRLDAPRTRVPAGAVGLAGGFSGAYPRETPGGWRLIGTTSAALFDPDAAEPALLRPGMRVQFVPARTPTRPPAAPARTAAPAPNRTAPAAALTVTAPGLLATVQDQGRPGHLAEGIAVSGAADRAALRTAARLLGNREDAAGVEITLGRFRATAHRDLWIAVTGAWGGIRVAGRDVDPYTAVHWPAGTDLELDAFAAGVRAYLGVRGGIAAATLLGSRATDTLARLGPAPLAAGDTLGLAADIAGPIPPEDLHPWGPPPDILDLPVAPGPRADWFTPAALELLHTAEWTVTADADRVGIRLDGPALDRRSGGELPSEGMLPGGLQVPPRGRPVILGPDGPVTGGYPVIAVVTDAARDLLAQARPGTRLRLRSARPTAAT